ncbi:MAG: HepT-like ribonuclease domain-containing protein [Spirochaetota bacterium]
MNRQRLELDNRLEACATRTELGSPRNYGDCLRLLQEFKYLPPELAGILIRIVGFRNLLIHEYATIDNVRLYNFLDELSVFRDYAKAIRQFL